MELSTLDVDYGTWRQGVSNLLHVGAFSGGNGEERRDSMMRGEHFTVPESASTTAMKQNTDVLAQMNSTSAANDYIYAAVTSEQDRVGLLDALAKRDVYKLREQSLGTVYTEALSKFLTKVTRLVLLGAILVIAVLSATSQSRISKRTGVVLAVLVVWLVGVYILLMVANAATRRNDDWGHYYWSVDASGSKVQNSRGTCN